MKISARKRKGGMTIRFKAGKGEGGDLRDALFASVGTEFTPAAMVEHLATVGYRQETMTTEESGSFTADLAKEPAA